MGRDKAVLLVGGEPMAQRIARALGDGGLSTVFIVGGDREALARLDVPVVDDQWPGQGPLGGVLTALDHASGSDVVVLGCDTPLVSAATVATLAATGPDADVVLAVDGTRPHPLVARYAARCAHRLRQRFDAGVRAMHEAIDGLQIATVAVPAGELRNVNRPADVELVSRMLEAEVSVRGAGTLRRSEPGHERPGADGAESGKLEAR